MPPSADVERFGRLDILVNNAGTNIRKAPQDLTAQDWHLVVDTNLTSTFLCSQAAYAHMLRAGGGKIINIGSIDVDLRDAICHRLRGK
jgi:2-dehydro-3-deoxy-D-gluconate 5-dehydrogenase